jgi:hypothetical protein
MAAHGLVWATLQIARQLLKLDIVKSMSELKKCVPPSYPTPHCSLRPMQPQHALCLPNSGESSSSESEDDAANQWDAAADERLLASHER